MTTDPKTQIAVELQGNATRLRRQAQKAERQWRAEHGFPRTGPLPDKPVRRREPKPLERGEIKRRDERRLRRIEREALRVPLLKGVGGDDGPGLIKRADRDERHR